ncbi:acyltransferase [Candidatus Pelagibacter sp.]|nr:acyltransferase [Candidatus Pelagibacter sp.]
MINNLQLLRAFAAINVVYLHVLIGGESYGKPSIVFPYVGGWGANGVDIFFVISGFVMIYTHSINPKTILNFYKSRILRIVPVYWLITSFIILIYFFFPNIFRSLIIDIKSSISSFLFVSQILNSSHPIINLGWTLEWEMLFYLIFGLALYFRTLNRIIISIFFMMVLIIFVSEKLYFLEFFLGVISGYLYIKLKKINQNTGFIILVLGILALLMSLNPNSKLVDYDRVLIWGLPATLIVIGATYSKQVKNQFILYLGDASYSIYLLQMLTIPGFYKIITHLNINIDNTFLSIICLLSSITFGCIFYSYVEKKLKLVKNKKYI